MRMAFPPTYVLPSKCRSAKSGMFRFRKPVLLSLKGRWRPLSLVLNTTSSLWQTDDLSVQG